GNQWQGGNLQGDGQQGNDWQGGDYQGGIQQGNNWQGDSWNGALSGGSIGQEDVGGGVSGGYSSGWGDGPENPELTQRPTSTPDPALISTPTPILTLTPTPVLTSTPTPIPTLTPTPTPTAVPTAALTPSVRPVSPEPSGAVDDNREEAVRLQVSYYSFKVEEGDSLVFRVKSDGPVHLLSVRLAGREAVWDWDGRDIVLDKSAGMDGMVEILALYEEGEKPEFERR
ncbi:MAG: hypothetical protein Q4C91_21195, partial [Eubacteriales bacterium]|nr:hypothetical protein [Eubacteriales bacterium]